ncbi:MAG: (deoxy)nucleoside triphosphate pyrophosphohydrolase [Myxococcales bacterium]
MRVVAALVWRDGSVLVQQRRPGTSRGLLWEFPGGKVEPGETEAAALARECREEMGIEVEVGPLEARNVHSYEDLDVELLLYRCRIVAGEPKPIHGHAVRFAPVSELRSLPFSEADLPFVELLFGEGSAGRTRPRGAPRAFRGSP